MNKQHIDAIITAGLLSESLEDTGCLKLNKIQAIALDLGGTDFAASEGVGYVEITGPENAQEFLNFLDSEDCVEAYDVTTDGDGTDDAENLLAYPEDTKFGVTFYLSEDHVKYDDVEVESEEVEEAIKGWKNAHSDLMKARSERASASHTATLVRLNKDGKESGMRDAKSTYPDEKAAREKAEYWRKNNPGMELRYNLYVNGEFVEILESTPSKLSESSLVKPSLVDEFGEPLNEVAKRITMNHRGVKKIKMQCPKGFKYSPSQNACVKIGGDELAKQRKASIKAVMSRKAGGKALAARAALRTKKAMNFRRAAGLSK